MIESAKANFRDSLIDVPFTVAPVPNDPRSFIISLAGTRAATLVNLPDDATAIHGRLMDMLVNLLLVDIREGRAYKQPFITVLDTITAIDTVTSTTQPTPGEDV